MGLEITNYCNCLRGQVVRGRADMKFCEFYENRNFLVDFEGALDYSIKHDIVLK